MDFHEKIFALRKAHGVTQAEAAEAVGVAVRQYQRFEKGEQKPGFDNLLKIADYYQVSVDWLMGRTDQREINR